MGIQRLQSCLISLLAMSVLLLLVIFSIAVESSPVDDSTLAPRFTLLERSLKNVPSIAITFPDGYEDILMLNIFESNSGDGNRIIGEDECHYFGHLANEPEACVAATGCVGSEDMEFTILSDHSTGSSIYKWTKDGLVEVVQNEIIDYTDTGNKNSSAFGGIKSPTIKERAFVSEDRMPTSLGEKCDGRSCILPETMSLKVKVGYLDGYYNLWKGHTEKIENEIAKAWVHTQAYFCHKSLGTKISIERVSTKHYPGFSPALKDHSEKEKSWIIQYLNELSYGIADKELHPDDETCLMVFVDAYMFLTSILGMAKTATACVRTDATSINFFDDDDAAHNGLLMAHEIGHNIGMLHDHKSRDHRQIWDNLGFTSQKPYVCYQADGAVMQGSMGSKYWSKCSVMDLEIYYEYIRIEKRKKKGTLEAAPNACNPVN